VDSADHTLRLLTEIRDAVRSTNVRVEETNTRLDQTNERLENLGETLGRRIVESEMRTATAITELAVSVRDMTGLLRDALDLRDRVDHCERDIAELKRRLS
jgi:methyl-accepting chemotaxis protein